MRLPSRLELTLASMLAGVGLFSIRKRPPARPAAPPATDEPASDDDVIAGWQSTLTGEAPIPTAPSPTRSAWRITKQIAWNIFEHRLLTEAAGVTFYALLAIFPALAAIIAVYGLFATPTTVSQELDTASTILPGGGMDIIQGQLKNLSNQHSTALGLGAVLGPLISLWSANSGTKALFDALNVVYGEKETRSFVVRTLISLALTAGALVFLVIAMAAVVALPIVLDDLGLSSVSAVLLQALRWPLLLIIISVLLDLLYRFGPSRADATWRWISWGGVLSAVLWVLVSVGFSWYVANFNSFNRTYGSLGAVIGFMTWIWISSIIVLVGAELDAGLQPTSKTNKADVPV